MFGNPFLSRPSSEVYMRGRLPRRGERLVNGSIERGEESSGRTIAVDSLLRR